MCCRRARPYDEASAPHWLDNLADECLDEARSHGLGLVEFCERFDAIELWIDPEPNAQLQHGLAAGLFATACRTSLPRLSLGPDRLRVIGEQRPRKLAALRPHGCPIRNDHLETASSAWQPRRAPTPEAWFDLLTRGCERACRSFGQAVVALLEELPHRASGLGATEMRMLELVSEGHVHVRTMSFPGTRSPTRVGFSTIGKSGTCWTGLAHCPAPAVSGLDEGPFTLEMHNDRDASRSDTSRAGCRSPHSVRLFWRGRDDFSRHNPIHRWWGGTELTNDRLWRWNSALVAP